MCDVCSRRSSPPPPSYFTRSGQDGGDWRLRVIMEASECTAMQREDADWREEGDDGVELTTSEAGDAIVADEIVSAEGEQEEQETFVGVTNGNDTEESDRAPQVGESGGESVSFEAHFPDSVQETDEQLVDSDPVDTDDATSDISLEDANEAAALDLNDEDDDTPCPPTPPLSTPMNSALTYELSRGVMFNKYASATPSTQEQQSTTQPPSWVGFDTLDTSTMLPSDVTHVCSSVACQQLMHWKDARIHELQRALDQMVEAMAIQQRDLAAQRALLSRQSDHFTKLSMALHHERMAMQLHRERAGSAGRLRNQRSNTSAGIAMDSRRTTMPHVHSLPNITGGAAATIAIVEPPRVKARRSLLPPPPLPLTVLPLDGQPVTQLDREKSKSLSALEIRATIPQMPTIHEIDKFASDEAVPPVLLSEVSLYDREPSTVASTGTSDSSSDLLHGDPQSSVPQPDSVKKWSLGGRLRSIRWKN
jgi:hypothetical protein